ncbi:lytic murein transglycosylase [Pseudooceanicola sediminis]|uniref:Lytic murein transglycosylase n=1 Tax=Pseudooceanicola sediminis TaxID=2211117 RepID=A0A399J1Q4_9RHOB|nr:lytic murein transglycosylase [Pseudooceanicola sediminis]KAA2313588.1 lytic murein transglycosylase [Puniceibacterium sp. HSS470]RII38567.1 lytic murein transglycosylase [Pseudooceanicola sediminis]|tara:strand:- start:41968 stop:43143 length:1176 start_codon:yes stop_codon:yes gene_type:complete
MTLRALLTSFALLAPLPALAQSCGGPFGSFVQGLAREAIAKGHDPAQVSRFFAAASRTQAVIDADRKQGVFQLDFTSFARRLISQNRIDNGQKNAARHADTFARIQRDYGVPPGILLAFWAFETDYGGYQGDFNTLNALITLAHDCRRPELFRPQVFAALSLFEQGDFSPTSTTGAWAGEIGMVQMLPGDILENGVDGDGDGHVRLKTSAPDALMSGGRMLRSLGWAPNQPWLQEITLPAEMDWSQTGLRTTLSAARWQSLGVRPRSGSWQSTSLPASVILPQGRHGPAFLAYPNFSVLFEWNQSFTYVLTAAYFATRLSGAPVFAPGNPDPGLSGPELKALQQELQRRGYDVGGVDGILGEKSREAVQAVQKQLGLPADAWPTRALLERL